MEKNILQALEQTVTWLPEKRCFWDDTQSLTFRQLQEEAQALGSFLLRAGITGRRAAVYMKRSPRAIAAFFGAVYAGCCYIPLDEEMPRLRVTQLLERSEPAIILCDDTTAPMLDGTQYEEICVRYSAASKTRINEASLRSVRQRQVDTDPVYILFTPGADGEPRGVMASHRNLLDSTLQLGSAIGASSNSVFGSQSPFSLDACLREILCTVRWGGSCCILPRSQFSFPVKLVETLNRNRVNTICWAASALMLISALDTFRAKVPAFLHTVVFAGEALPARQLQLWREALPEARFLSLYGPTEVSGTGCYYEITRDLGPGEPIPIGAPFANTGILLLDEDGRESQAGEICLRGSCLALGYFRDPKATAAAFVQNPAREDCPDRIFRTGDYGAYNARGELICLGRHDRQFRHMGHRIEPGEIEAAAAAHPGVHFTCCQYAQQTGKIQLYYTGTCSCQEMTLWLKERLPNYMLPRSLYLLEFMPLTPNGRIDRTRLQQFRAEGGSSL